MGADMVCRLSISRCCHGMSAQHIGADNHMVCRLSILVLTWYVGSAYGC